MSEQTSIGNELMDSVLEASQNKPANGSKGSANGFPQSTSIDMLMDVNLQVSVELGRTRMTVRQVLDLQKGSVVELDRMAGDAVDIFVNDHLIARGEVVVVDDKFGVRISQLITNNKENGAL